MISLLLRCYHWRPLPQVKFLSQQTRVCHNNNNNKIATNTCLSRQNVCRDKHTFVTTRSMFCRDKCVYRNKTCHGKIMFAATKVLSWQKYVCCDKHTTKMILAACSSRQWYCASHGADTCTKRCTCRKVSGFGLIKIKTIVLKVKLKLWKEQCFKCFKTTLAF